MIRKTYNAEVILTVVNNYEEELTEQDMDFAPIEAEVKVNNLGYFQFDKNQLGIQLVIKGEKNGDNQDQDMARW
jgi:hypothetical protein